MESKISSNREFNEIKVTVPWGIVVGRWYGDQRTQPILALHGWLDNCGSFVKLAPLLAPHVSVLCIDLPGHGRSSHMPAGVVYHNLEFTRTVLHVMKAFKWPKVTLMGHSMGGSVAFLFAGIFPERVERIISLDAIYVAYKDPDTLVSTMSSFAAKLMLADERVLLGTNSEPPSYTLDQCVQLLHDASELSIDDCKYILERNISKSTVHPGKYYFSRDSRLKYMMELNVDDKLGTEMIERMASVPLPYLLIRAGSSRTLFQSSQALLTILLKKNRCAELHVIPNASHHLHLSDPKPVARVILDFIKKYPSSLSSPLVGDDDPKTKL